MIQARELTKRYGDKVAVDGASFTIRPGVVTGFLGPNGSGKSTTMRMIVGLDRPTAGEVTVNGRRYAEHPAPLHEVGVLLDAKAVHTGRSAFNHLRAMAATHGIGRRRVREVIEMTGLETVAHRRVGGFSLGMGQRLGIAAAMLGDPRTLILDEPVNGLDPEGVKWVRTTARRLAGEGRTVFISSHLMSEMALTADELLIIGRGRIIASASMDDIVARAQETEVYVRSPQATELAELVVRDGGTATALQPGALRVTGLGSDRVGDLATQARLRLHELTPQRASLEDAYLSLTSEAVEYRSDPAETTGEES